MYIYHVLKKKVIISIFSFILYFVPSGGPLDTSESAHVSSPEFKLKSTVPSKAYCFKQLRSRYSWRATGPLQFKILSMYKNREEDLDSSDFSDLKFS